AKMAQQSSTPIDDNDKVHLVRMVAGLLAIEVLLHDQYHPNDVKLRSPRIAALRQSRRTKETGLDKQ
ncbi:MAG: hypothetical protein R2844_23915, partial [Caldilineales bacterium]